MQLIVSDKWFFKVYGMKAEKEFLQEIKLFWKWVGVPTAFIVGPHGAQMKNEVREFYHKVITTLRVLEESTQLANRAEIYIRFIKEGARKDTWGTNPPDVLWCYAAEQQTQILTLTAKNILHLQEYNIYTATIGISWRYLPFRQ